VSYIHGTEPAEQERLAILNRMTNAAFLEFLNVAPGQHVLEIGSGLGILACAVAGTADDVHVVGVENAAAQIAAAASHPRVIYLHGDAHRLDFDDATFDVSYARYLLEHLRDPEAALREMRRVTRPGGHVAACENDTSLVRLDPPCPAFDSAWEKFQLHQRALGGDSLIGRRLYRLFRNAGFDQIELSVQPEVHWHGSLLFVPWVRNLVGNLDSARSAMVASGLATPGDFTAAVAELHALLADRTASAHFMWNRARAVR
jgi:ubiquinone/menaquinone biosynthesis C-methylase UbiE